MTPQQIIDYWFAGCEDDAAALKKRGSFWYGADPATDEVMRRLFSAVHARAALGELQDWAETAGGRLALILLLDQFSRNLYRGKPQAFSQDEQAQRLCLAGMNLGHDAELHPVHRSFFYMPLEHAEERELQEKSVASYQQMAAQAAPAFQAYFEDALKWAREHASVVQRFGRFPHRNRVLGRQGTEEEDNYLESGGSSYGQ